MILKILLLFFLNTCIYATEVEYTFDDQAQGWLKLFEEGLPWNDAKVRCEFDDSVLASPLVTDLRDAIKQHILQRNRNILTIYVGVHAEFNTGDFFSVEGVHISKLPVSFLNSGNMNYKSPESCIVWDLRNDELRKVKCERNYPYICYKKITSAQLPIGTEHEQTTESNHPTLTPEIQTQPNPWTQINQPSQPNHPTNQGSEQNPRGRTNQGSQQNPRDQTNQGSQQNQWDQMTPGPQKNPRDHTNPGSQQNPRDHSNQRTQPNPRDQTNQGSQQNQWDQMNPGSQQNPRDHTNQGSQQNPRDHSNQGSQPNLRDQTNQGSQQNQWEQMNPGSQQNPRDHTNQGSQQNPRDHSNQGSQPNLRDHTNQRTQQNSRDQTNQGSQQNQWTRTNQGSQQAQYTKCAVDGANVFIINSEMQSAVLKNLVNYPAVTVIFADIVYLSNVSDGQSWHVVFQKKQHQQQTRTAEIIPLQVNLIENITQGIQNLPQGPQLNLSTQGSSSGSQEYKPSNNGVSQNTQRPNTPTNRRTPVPILKYTWDQQGKVGMKVKFADTWHSARSKCESEGAVLASPLNAEILGAIQRYVSIVRPLFTRLYTGVITNFTNGDFYSIEGVSIKKMPVLLDPGSEDGYDNTESCLVMSTFDNIVRNVKCTKKYPYVCLKKMTAVHGCGRGPGYKYEDRTGSCYKFHKNGQPWNNAYRTCKNEGGYLAIINSQQESNAMTELFAKNPANSISGYYKNNAHIGRFYDKEKKIWVTVKNERLEESGFIGWAATEPNNANGNEDCGTLGRNGFIYDDPCHLKLAFICEKPSELIYRNPNENNKP